MKALLVGGGSIGARHLENLTHLENIQIALVEPIAASRKFLCAEHKITGFENLSGGLEWHPHFVVIASPSHLHVEQALLAADKKCHLFIEKPLSHSLVGLSKLQEVVKAHDLITLVGCNMRFHPGPVTVKRLIESGIIGKIIAARIQTGSYLPRWRPQQNYRESYSASPEWGGAILDCIHELDLALWYFGPAQLLAATHLPATTLALQTDGLAEILLRHHSGTLSSVHLNFIQRDYSRMCQIIGSEGTIYWDFITGQVRVMDSCGQQIQLISQPYGWELNQMYVDEMRYFVEAVQQQNATFHSVADAVETLKIALAIKSFPSSC